MAMCSSCSGKSSSGKSNSYTPKKMSSGTYKSASKKSGYSGGSGQGFGSPKVKMSFGGGRGR